MDVETDSKLGRCHMVCLFPSLLPKVPHHTLWNKRENSRRTCVSLMIRLLGPIPWSWNSRENGFPPTPASTSFIQLLKPQWLERHLG